MRFLWYTSNPALTIRISATVMAAGIRKFEDLSVTGASVGVSIVVKGLPKEPEWS